MVTVEMIFEVGEDVATAAAGLPKKPVDIVCESSEFSVDRRWMKSETEHAPASRVLRFP